MTSDSCSSCKTFQKRFAWKNGDEHLVTQEENVCLCLNYQKNVNLDCGNVNKTKQSVLPNANIQYLITKSIRIFNVRTKVRAKM